MPPPPAPRSRRTIIVGLAIVALIVAGLLVWRHDRTPAADEVAAFLNRTRGAGRLRFSVDRMEAHPRGDSGQELTVVATARPTAPLYARIDTADYLHRTFRLDAEATSEARRLLSGQGSSPDPDFRGAAPFPADPWKAVILQTTTPANATFAFNGVIEAHRDGGVWAFVLASGGLEGGDPHGEARSALGESAYVAGETGDDTRLRTLVADFNAYAGRVAGIRRDLDSARAAAADGRRRAFLATIVPGRVFRGAAVETGREQEMPLYLEITGLSPEHEVRAVLRNEGSWHIARSFQGTWSADDRFEKPVLRLTSLPGQSIRGAGPFLENAQAWTFNLAVGAQGELTEQNRYYQYRFQPLAPEQAAAVQTRLEGEFAGAVAATVPGSLYLGNAVSRASGASETVLLRFTQRSPGGESLEASIEATTHAWKRTWHGIILSNVRRSGGAPIRLRTGPTEAVEGAPGGSVLGDPGDLELRLGLEQGSLVGGDERFTYRLAVAGPADLQRLEAARLERARRLAGVIRHGIVFDGLIRQERGDAFRIRFEFVRINRATGAITARIRSLDEVNIYREFLGSFEPSGDSVVLDTTELGSLDRDYNLNIPFLISRAPSTLHLALEGQVVRGRIAGNPRWAMGFMADAFLAVPTEAPEPDSPPADGSVFPAFPKKEGAYLLDQGSWTPLPANQAHVVAEPIKTAGDGEGPGIPTSISGLVSMGMGEITKGGGRRKDKAKDTISYLEFDGKDPRPVAHGPAIVLLFIGPEQEGEPTAGLAPAEIMKDGRRRVKLAPGLAEGNRLGVLPQAAYVRKVAPNAILLTTTTGPATPGPYIFSAGGGFELTEE